MNQPLPLQTSQVRSMPHNPRIMIIEDEPFQREWLARIARPFSSHIHLARDGVEALQMLEYMEPPELLLCDLNMPNMDGVTFLRHLAGRQVQCSVVLISAADSDVMGSVSQMIHLYGMTLAAVLKKPASRHQLIELLQRSQQGELTRAINSPPCHRRIVKHCRWRSPLASSSPISSPTSAPPVDGSLVPRHWCAGIIHSMEF